MYVAAETTGPMYADAESGAGPMYAAAESGAIPMYAAAETSSSMYAVAELLGRILAVKVPYLRT